MAAPGACATGGLLNVLPTRGPSPAVRAYVRWTLRHGRLLWLVALLLAIPATLRTVHLYVHLRSEIEQLLPRQAPSVRALDEMRARNPGLEFLGVVAQVPTSADMPAAERFVDDLAARIRTYPPEMVQDVRSNNSAEKKFLEKHAPLYTDFADLTEILRRVEARRDYEVSKEQGGLLDEDETPPSLDTTDIEKKYDAKPRATSRTTSRAASSAPRCSSRSAAFTTGSQGPRSSSSA